jgi:hypothetical protein
MLRSFGMVPVHISHDRRILHIAFADKIEHRALFAIEQMIECKTEACLTTRGEVETALDRIEEQIPGSEQLFERVSDLEETTRIISSYASTMHASEIRVAFRGELLWARIVGNGLCGNLLFSRTAEKVLQFPNKKFRARVFS